MPTLYLSDLDGTLLNTQQRLSSYTSATINRLVEEGMLFSYATARSWHTAHKVTKGLSARIPLIVYNGALILDSFTQEILLRNTFSDEEAAQILNDLMAADVHPVVYTFAEGKEKFCYLSDRISDGVKQYVQSRSGDVRDTPLQDEKKLLQGETFYFTCIDAREKLEPLYHKWAERFHCVYSEDIYFQTQWLEIMPKAASKANAARQLAAHLGCDRIVAFGDAVNDISLFEAADECYAVRNAAEVLKQRATSVIESNDEDGVARWLESNWKK